MTVEAAQSIRNQPEAVIHIGHLPADDVRYLTADAQRRLQRQARIEWRFRSANRMRDDGKVNRAILSDDLIEPDFGVVVGIPARGHVLRAARRSNKDSVDAQRHAVARDLNLLVGSERPGAGDDGQPALHFFHGNFQHPSFFLARQIKDLAGLRIDAEASTGAHEFIVVKEVAQEPSIGLLVDLHMPVERQQHGHIEMITDSGQVSIHDGLLDQFNDQCASYSMGTASISTKATTQGAFERLAQAWLVPRWISTSPATSLVSPTSMTAQISPESTIA